MARPKTETFPDPDDEPERGRTIRRRRSGAAPAPPRALDGAERAARDADFGRDADAWAASRPSPEIAARRQHARELKQARRQLAGASAFAAALWAKDRETRPLDVNSRALRDALEPFSRAYYAFEIATLVRLARADLRHGRWLSHADHRENLGLTIAEARWRHFPWVRQRRGQRSGSAKGGKSQQAERAAEHAEERERWLDAATKIAAQRVRDERPPLSLRKLAPVIADRFGASEHTVRKFLRAKMIK